METQTPRYSRISRLSNGKSDNNTATFVCLYVSAKRWRRLLRRVATALIDLFMIRLIINLFLALYKFVVYLRTLPISLTLGADV